MSWVKETGLTLLAMGIIGLKLETTLLPEQPHLEDYRYDLLHPAFFSFLFLSLLSLKEELLYRPTWPQTQNSPAPAFPAAELTDRHVLPTTPGFDELFL